MRRGLGGRWDEEPPHHAPAFVLTHYAHDPIEMDGGTIVHFVTAGFDAAYARAVRAAREREVLIAGGASTMRQPFAAGVIDELMLDLALRGLPSIEKLRRSDSQSIEAERNLIRDIAGELRERPRGS